MTYNNIFPLLLCFLSCYVSATAQVKNIHGPYLQNVKATEATIVWEADKQSVGWVETAPDDGSNFYSWERAKHYDCKNGVKNVSLIHTVKLTGLKAGTAIRYRVFSQEVLSHNGTQVNYDSRVAAGDVYSQAPLKFTTLNPDKKETSFIVLNDIHGRNNDIEPLLKQADYKNKDLFFLNGDMISVLNAKEDFFTGFMDDCIRLFAREKSPYYARGNHETRGEFSTHFQDYFSPKEPHLYFTVRQGLVFFILLDTGEDKPDGDIEYSGIVDYDNYRTEQAEWLKTLPADPDYQTAKFRVVICHMPTRDSESDWHGMRDCCKKFTPILNTMNIDVMLGGHTHRDSYHEPNAEIHYPVLINSNVGIVEATADDKEMNIKVKHPKGKVITQKTFKAKN